VWLALCLAGCGGAEKNPREKPADAPAARFVGRVDASDPAAPKFAWSGTGFVARVSGSNISVKLTTEGASSPVFFQPIVDGTFGDRFSIPNGEQTIALGTGLADGEHLVEVYRENEGNVGRTIFGGFVEGALLPPPAVPERSIEIVGDSISAGYGNLGSEEHPNYGADPNGGCRFSTETESATMTYGAIAGRELGASVSIVALSGWGAFRSNAGSTRDVLATVYGNTLGIQAEPAWEFREQADVVVVNLGTNDFAMTPGPTEAEFKGAFSALLATIRGKHPDAWIYCMIGPLLYGAGLTDATTYLQAIVNEKNGAGDARVKLLNFGQQNGSLGTGCDWHPNVTVQTQMADFLVSDIRTTLGW
jgi:lysophospholipase L1-like esterase